MHIIEKREQLSFAVTGDWVCFSTPPVFTAIRADGFFVAVCVGNEGNEDHSARALHIAEMMWKKVACPPCIILTKGFFSDGWRVFAYCPLPGTTMAACFPAAERMERELASSVREVFERATGSAKTGAANQQGLAPGMAQLTFALQQAAIGGEVPDTALVRGRLALEVTLTQEALTFLGIQAKPFTADVLLDGLRKAIEQGKVRLVLVPAGGAVEADENLSEG